MTTNKLPNLLPIYNNKGEIMKHEIIMNEAEIATYPNPQKALEALKQKMIAQLTEQYTLVATNEGKALKYTATLKG